MASLEFNLKNICEALGTVKTKWYEIGIQLGIDRSRLLEFKKEDEPLSAVVDYLLRGNLSTSEAQFSWESIVKSLKSSYVGESGLAEEISRKCCQQTKVQKDNSKLLLTFETDYCPQPTQEIDDVHQDNNGTSNPDESMDPAVKSDLEFMLRKYLKEIMVKFASYIYCLREAIEEKQVSLENLRSFLLSLPATSKSYKGQNLALLAGKEAELRKCESIVDVFDFLTTKCASFLNWEIFEYIHSHFNVADDHERLKYPEHLKAYIKKHKISEFSKINPLLKSKVGSKELIVKYDIKTTCSLAKVDELKTFIAEIMDLSPSALEIVDIDDGCVIVTFLIPASIADALFMSETVFSPQQEERFQAASVLWIKCNGHSFTFERQEQLKNEDCVEAPEKLEYMKKYNRLVARIANSLSIKHCETLCFFYAGDVIPKSFAENPGNNPLKLLERMQDAKIFSHDKPEKLAELMKYLDFIEMESIVQEFIEKNKIIIPSLRRHLSSDFTESDDHGSPSHSTHLAIQKLKEQLTCSICLGTYTDPKHLLCQHAYCQQCLVELVNQDQQGQSFLTCPTCRQVTFLPPSGVAGLQPDIRVNQLLEIVSEDQNEGATAAPRVCSPEIKFSEINLHGNSFPFCPDHSEKIMELFCEACHEPICLKCILKGGRHYSHNCEEFDVAFRRCKRMIPILLKVIDRALSNFDAHREKISNQTTIVVEEVHHTSALDIQKTEYITLIHQITKAKLKSLASQRDLIETMQIQLDRHLKSVQENEKGLTLVNCNTVKEVNRLNTTLLSGALEPSMQADIMLISLGREGWQVCEGSRPNPRMCLLSNYNFNATVGQASTILLRTTSFNNQPCKVSLTAIDCELIHEKTKATTKGTIARGRKFYLYKISYKPATTGRHQLHIKVENQHIKASPFFFKVKGN